VGVEAGTLGVTGGTGRTVRTDIPARLDRLPWSRWHWIVIVALGITWILDGLEVTLVGSISGVLTDKSTLALSPAQATAAGSFYLAGAVGGALLFGYLTDRFGRKKLFMVTLGVYLVFTVATALAWNFWSFMLFRVLAGAGIGGEYSAINSAIDELVPARVRGRVALAINSSWWIGTAAAAGLTVVLLNELAVNAGWRVGFGLGAILAIGILFVRHMVPESPRWLLTHGRADEAEQVVRQIEAEVKKSHPDLPEPEGEPLEIEQRRSIGFIAIARHVAKEYPDRGVLGFSLMASQAVLYNATLFGMVQVLTTFFHASKTNAPLHHPVRGRQPARPLAARAALRHDRPQDHDLRQLHQLRRDPARHRLALQPAAALGDHVDDLLGGHVLLRLRRRVGRLPDRQRDLPDGDAGDGDRALLRLRHRRRDRRPLDVREDDRDRLVRLGHLRLRDRRRDHGDRRAGRDPARRRRRAPLARSRRPPDQCRQPLRP
jgi:MFS family permease